MLENLNVHITMTNEYTQLQNWKCRVFLSGIYSSTFKMLVSPITFSLEIPNRLRRNQQESTAHSSPNLTDSIQNEDTLRSHFNPFFYFYIAIYKAHQNKNNLLVYGTTNFPCRNMQKIHMKRRIYATSCQNSNIGRSS